MRWGLEEAQSKIAGQACRGPRAGEQKPDMRCGTLGTSGHVTAKPSIRNWGVLINPAFTRGRSCVLPREACTVFASRYGRGGVAPPGNRAPNRENKLQPEAGGEN